MRNLRFLVFFSSMLLLASCQIYQGQHWFGTRPSDESLNLAVQETLRNHPDLAPFTLHVETKDKIVFLSGYVKTIRQSDTAWSLASKVPGVQSVENNIIVRK